MSNTTIRTSFITTCAFLLYTLGIVAPVLAADDREQTGQAEIQIPTRLKEKIKLFEKYLTKVYGQNNPFLTLTTQIQLLEELTLQIAKKEVKYNLQAGRSRTLADHLALIEGELTDLLYQSISTDDIAEHMKRLFTHVAHAFLYVEQRCSREIGNLDTVINAFKASEGEEKRFIETLVAGGALSTLQPLIIGLVSLLAGYGIYRTCKSAVSRRRDICNNKMQVALNQYDEKLKDTVKKELKASRKTLEAKLKEYVDHDPVAKKQLRELMHKKYLEDYPTRWERFKHWWRRSGEKLSIISRDQSKACEDSVAQLYSLKKNASLASHE